MLKHLVRKFRQQSLYDQSPTGSDDELDDSGCAAPSSSPIDESTPIDTSNALLLDYCSGPPTVVQASKANSLAPFGFADDGASRDSVYSSTVSCSSARSFAPEDSRDSSLGSESGIGMDSKTAPEEEDTIGTPKTIESVFVPVGASPFHPIGTRRYLRAVAHRPSLDSKATDLPPRCRFLSAATAPVVLVEQQITPDRRKRPPSAMSISSRTSSIVSADVAAIGAQTASLAFASASVADVQVAQVFGTSPDDAPPLKLCHGDVDDEVARINDYRPTQSVSLDSLVSAECTFDAIEAKHVDAKEEEEEEEETGPSTLTDRPTLNFEKMREQGVSRPKSRTGAGRSLPIKCARRKK